MYEIGDAVLYNIFIGVVVEVKGSDLVCMCSDGKEHIFPASECNLVCTYKQTLSQFEEVLRNVTR